MRYAYIILKYFRHYNPEQIQSYLYLDSSVQNRLRYGILLDIEKYATAEGLIAYVDGETGEPT